MTKPVLTDWDSAKSDAFHKQVVTARHSLNESPMFNDEGLIKLFDTYPRDQFNVYTMGSGAENAHTFRHGLVGDTPGIDLLNACKSGRIWFNFRKANLHVPELSEMADAMFAELEAKVPGLKTFKRDLGVLVSSPNVEVFYHFDVPHVLLWQVRGRKRVWAYPPQAPYLSDNDMENVVLRTTEEEIPYRADYEAGAQIIDLEPGMVVSWPQNAPHRVVNHDVMNVSLSVEYMTPQGLLRANVIYANGVLRRQFGANPSIANDRGVAALGKFAFARAHKALFSRDVYRKDKPPTFVVDPMQERGVRELNAAQ